MRHVASPKDASVNNLHRPWRAVLPAVDPRPRQLSGSPPPAWHAQRARLRGLLVINTYALAFGPLSSWPIVALRYVARNSAWQPAPLSFAKLEHSSLFASSATSCAPSGSMPATAAPKLGSVDRDQTERLTIGSGGNLLPQPECPRAAITFDPSFSITFSQPHQRHASLSQTATPSALPLITLRPIARTSARLAAHPLNDDLGPDDTTVVIRRGLADVELLHPGVRLDRAERHRLVDGERRTEQHAGQLYRRE